MIGVAIRALLVADAAIAARVGDRVFQSRIPQTEALPAIVYLVVSDVPEEDKDYPASFDDVRVQVSVYAESFQAAAEIAALVRARLDGLSAAEAGVTLHQVRRVNRQDFYEEDARVHHIVEDFKTRVTI